MQCTQKAKTRSNEFAKSATAKGIEPQTQDVLKEHLLASAGSPQKGPPYGILCTIQRQ